MLVSLMTSISETTSKTELDSIRIRPEYRETPESKMD